MKITTTKKTKLVLIEIPKHVEYHKQGMREALIDTVDIVGRETENLTTKQRKTGRVYLRRGREHQASAAGEPFASETGRLLRSYNGKVASWHTMRVGFSAEYGEFVETGTSRMRARPTLILAINNTVGDTIDLFYQRFKERAKV